MGTNGRAWLRIGDGDTVMTSHVTGSGDPEGFGTALLATGGKMNLAIAAGQALMGEAFVAGKDVAGVKLWDEYSIDNVCDQMEDMELDTDQVEAVVSAALAGDEEAVRDSGLMTDDVQETMWTYENNDNGMYDKATAEDEFRRSLWHVGTEERGALVSRGVEVLEAREATRRIIAASEKAWELCRGSHDYYWNGEEFRTMFWIFENRKDSEYGRVSEMFEAPLMSVLAVGGRWGVRVQDSLDALNEYMREGMTSADERSLRETMMTAVEEGMERSSLFGGHLSDAVEVAWARMEASEMDGAAAEGARKAKRTL